MTYIVSTDGKVPSDELISQIAVREGKSFDFIHGPSLNKIDPFISELDRKDNWRLILLVPIKNIEKRVDIYIISEEEQKKEMINYLKDARPKMQDSETFSGVMVWNFLYDKGIIKDGDGGQ